MNSRFEPATKGQLALLGQLVEQAIQTDGAPPFSDQSLVDFESGDRALLGEAGVSAAIFNDEEFELVVAPALRGRGNGRSLVAQLLALESPPSAAWSHGDLPGARALAAEFGFVATRTLLQLRAPVSSTVGVPAPGIRAFQPGVDDASWLELNAQAFAEHPEQGKLTQHDLDARKAEPWFEPQDFLILEREGRFAGFCWLKVTGSGNERIGEIYAVGVAPQHQGEGLGRLLMHAGLSHLSSIGVRTAALYVESDNVPAVELYRSLGFTQHTIDVRYVAPGNAQASTASAAP